MHSIEIKSLWRTVTILDRTRKMSKEINALMFKWVKINTKWIDFSKNEIKDIDLDIPFENMDAATEKSIELQCWLTPEDIEKITDWDYQLLSEEISKKK